MRGPGTYDDGKKFGDGAKSFEIRGKPVSPKASDVPGVGSYSPDESPTRYRNPAVKIRPPSENRPNPNTQ